MEEGRQEPGIESPVCGLCAGQATPLTQQPYLCTVDSSDLYSVVGVEQGGDSGSTYPGPCVWSKAGCHFSPCTSASAVWDPVWERVRSLCGLWSSSAVEHLHRCVQGLGFKPQLCFGLV